MTEPNSGVHIEYGSVDELLAEYKSYMKDPKNIDIGANYLLNSLIDETILGVVFEVHYAVKSGVAVSVDGKPEDTKAFSITDIPDLDVFGASTTAKKTIDCTCPNCDRLVAASRFAPHLEKCMGMGRNSSRIASRRIANSRGDRDNNYFQQNLTDDEDDADWSGERRKKKFQAIRTNGSKKNGKTS